MAAPDRSEGRFAAMLNAKMQDLNLSIRDISNKTGSSYEAIRKLLKGYSYPSVWMIKTLAKLLHMDEDELSKAATADRIEHRYGATAAILGGKDPDAAPLMKLWHRLSQQHKDAVMAILRSWAEEDSPSRRRRA